MCFKKPPSVLLCVGVRTTHQGDLRPKNVRIVMEECEWDVRTGDNCCVLFLFQAVLSRSAEINTVVRKKFFLNKDRFVHERTCHVN